MNRLPDRTYTVYHMDFREMESRVRSGELENYDYDICYDEATKIYYTVRVWLKLPATKELSTVSLNAVS